MTRARYTADVLGGVICVIDLDLGMSVTNDAEAVVAEVVRDHGNLPIVYRDTDGVWDGLRHEAGKFAGFQPLRAATRAAALKEISDGK